MFKNISRTVFIISLVSLFNDFSSEMLYPVMPLYLAQIGYGGLVIGIIEGVAEFIAGLTKIYAGSLSDNMQRRLPFVNLGYALSVVSRPLMVMVQHAGMICAGRSIDKMGKGIRTGARDALLADESHAGNRAEVFGFHRSMDSLGAIFGPLSAMIYLYFYPEDYRSVFFIALLPGVAALVLTFFIREKKRGLQKDQHITYSLSKHFSFFRLAPRPYLRFLVVMLAFALINSSDMFLLLRASQSGMKADEVLMMYILFNLVFSLGAFPAGILADKMNKKILLGTGLLLYAAAYFLMAFFPQQTYLVVAFCLYGLYYAFTQGIVKVLLIEKVQSENKSNAIGFYEGLNSFCLLAANALAGLVWYRFGAMLMLTCTGIIAMIIALVIILFYSKQDLLSGEIPGIKQ